MIEFLHSFEPQPVLFSIGALTVYWYGFFIVTGIAAAILVSFWLARHYELSSDTVFDLSFWLIIGGLIGARLYEILLMLPFYLANPWQAPKIWEGGLAIHGAIIAGLIVVWIFSRCQRLDFWRLAAVLTPGVALGQAIGRWGNYFNQEIFGPPTNLAWGIPINPINRPLEFITERFFHPTFLYESLGSILISILLIGANIYTIKKKRLGQRFFLWSVAFYVILYSLLRFGLEFIRLDYTPAVLGWRWPQIASLLLIMGAALLLIINSHASQNKDSR